MPWSGGSYTKGNNGTGGWAGDASLGIGIEAGRHDTQDNDFATGINQCLNKDGSNAATGNLNVGGFKVTNAATGTASGDLTTLGQVQAGINTQSTTLATTATRFSADTTGVSMALQKSRGASVGTNTIVTSGDTIGTLSFAGANGTTYTTAASIYAEVDGTPGATNDMPGRLILATTADASGTVTERVRIDNAGKVGINVTPDAQLSVTATGTTDSQRYAHFAASTQGCVERFYKSRNAAKGSHTIVNSGDDIASLVFYGSNGTSFDPAAEIAVQVDGTPGASADMPGRIVFKTSADASATPTERMRVTQGGDVGIGVTSIASTRLGIQGAGASSATNSLKCQNSAGYQLLMIRNDGLVQTGIDASLTFAPYNLTTASAANVVVDNSGSFLRSTSSLKYKRDVADLPYGLSHVLQLRPVTYKSKNEMDGETVFAGLIAEEVYQAGLPEFVQLAKDGSPDGLMYGNLVALLINAIKELSARVDALEA